MVAVGKDYRPEIYDRIPTTVVTNQQERTQTDTTTQSAIRPVKSQMLFELRSWLLDEYEKAVQDDGFFQSVKNNFSPYAKQAEPKNETKERIKLVQAKYLVAGGDARLMFDVTTEEAVVVVVVTRTR